MWQMRCPTMFIRLLRKLYNMHWWMWLTGREKPNRKTNKSSQIKPFEFWRLFNRRTRLWSEWFWPINDRQYSFEFCIFNVSRGYYCFVTVETWTSSRNIVAHSRDWKYQMKLDNLYCFFYNLIHVIIKY